VAIPNDQINRDWIVLQKTATVREIKQRVPRDQRRIQWIVTPIDAQEYAVYRVSDLIQFLTEALHVDAVTERLLNAQLENLNDFLKTYTRTAVERNANWDDVRDGWSPNADPPLVVLENGRPIGILKSSVRGGASDVDFLDQAPVSEPKSANGGGHPKNGGEKSPPTPGTLGGTEPSSVATPPARKINVSFEPPEQKDKPLQVGETYTLAFSVEMEQLAHAIAAAEFDQARFFPPNVDEVDVFVQLLSDDFRVLTKPQNLIVPREGKSLNRARFDIIPKHNGESELTAVFSKDGNAVQAITLKLNVGVAGQAAIVKSETLGRPVDAAGAVQPRGLSLWIDYKGEGFQVSVLDPEGTTSFVIPLQLHELELAISEARAVLETIVNFPTKNNSIYQAGIDIPAATNKKTLPMLAEAGYLLFQAIFLKPGINATGKAFAKRLRELVKQETLNIQIVSKEMLLPWGMLYLADRFNPNDIQPELFLGLKHIIEHTPMQADMNFPTTITSQPQLTVSLNLNKDIDKRMNFPLIGNQEKYWKGRADKGKVKVITRKDGNKLLDALADETTPDQIVYFYCHALTKGLNEGGAKAAMLQFGEAADETFTLRDFLLRAPNDIRLNAAPLVFLNACESAELSPLFYNGFMPYFVDKGARGMIGTECSVPALFAMDWAEKFFDQFLAGKTIGQIFLDLRRDYFFNHNNILGLLYAVYCDADTQVTPALQ